MAFVMTYSPALNKDSRTYDPLTFNVIQWVTYFHFHYIPLYKKEAKYTHTII